MISRRTSPDGLVLFESQVLARLGVPHAFSSRVGDLDLAGPPDSPVAPAGHPYQRLLAAMGLPGRQVVWVRQVHGSAVRSVTMADAHDHPQADGLLTRQAGLALTIRVADCVPVLLVAHRAGRPIVVAAVHAGWRGLVAGILPEAVKMIRDGDPSLPLAAAIGPCIGRERFEVGPEVAQAFRDAGLAEAVHENFGDKPHVDLQAAAVTQLRRVGLADADIDRSDLCTYRDSADFHSHRRDAGSAGRLAAVIALPT